MNEKKGLSKTHTREYIEQRVTISKEGCWEWRGSLSGSGYGQVSGWPYTAHGVAYRVFNGVVSEGEVVRHLCHNKKCCNPDHLKVGTHQDNWKDSETTHLKAASNRRGRPAHNSIPVMFRGKRYGSKEAARIDCKVTYRTVMRECSPI